MSEQTVFLVEDDYAVRDSLVGLLQAADFHVEAFGTPSELLSTLDVNRPGCLVLDFRLPEMDAIALHENLVELGCQLPFIVIAGSGAILDATHAMRRGAVDFIEKPLDRQVFLARVREAMQKDAALRRERLQDRDVEARLATLTPRELEVLKLVMTGMLTKQIADELGISAKTVEVHRSHITKKMEVESTVQLVRLCTSHALI